MDNPFYSLIKKLMKVLVNPHYEHLPVGNSAKICDVIVANSPLVKYRELHCVSLSIKNISSGELFSMTWLHQFSIISEILSGQLLSYLDPHVLQIRSTAFTSYYAKIECMYVVFALHNTH